jgi:4-hydroxy-2-oxoheptanedioate aldolase
MATIRPNRAKQKLAAGGTVLAVSGLVNGDMIDLMGPVGPDAVWIEAEHGPVDFGHIPDLTRACDLWGMTSIVRVGTNSYPTIYRTLDLGAQGVIVPHIDTEEDARLFVEAAKFAPIGRRGLYTSRQGYGVPDYLQVANDQTLLVALIEDIRAVRNLDRILTVEHIDVFFVAPSDLAASMGHIGRIDHPEVVEAREAALRRIVSAGGSAGTLLTNFDHLERYAGAGVRFFLTPAQPWLIEGGKDAMRRIAAIPGRS